jgi:hypothetical protein
VAAVGRLSNHYLLSAWICDRKNKIKTWPARSARAALPATACNCLQLPATALHYTLQRCRYRLRHRFGSFRQTNLRPVRRTLTLLVGEKLSHQRTVRNFDCSYTLILIINTLQAASACTSNTITLPASLSHIPVGSRSDQEHPSHTISKKTRKLINPSYSK